MSPEMIVCECCHLASQNGGRYGTACDLDHTDDQHPYGHRFVGSIPLTHTFDGEYHESVWWDECATCGVSLKDLGAYAYRTPEAARVKTTSLQRHVAWRGYLDALVRTGLIHNDEDPEWLDDYNVDADDLGRLMQPEQIAELARDFLGFIRAIEARATIGTIETFAATCVEDVWERIGFDHARTRNGYVGGFWDHGAGGEIESLAKISRDESALSLFGYAENGKLVSVEISR